MQDGDWISQVPRNKSNINTKYGLKKVWGGGRPSLDPSANSTEYDPTVAHQVDSLQNSHHCSKQQQGQRGAAFLTVSN